MGHDVDLGRDRVAAPHHDQVRFGDLAPVDPALDPDPGEPAGIGERVADRQILARPPHRMAQPVDAVALHDPHRAGVVIGPHRLRAVAAGGLGQPLGDLVECGVPGNRREGGQPHALVADPAQRLRQAQGMVLALGVAGDLGADDAGGVGLRARAAHPPDPLCVDALDLERAGARAIVRAHAGDNVEGQRIRSTLRFAPGYSDQAAGSSHPIGGGGRAARLPRGAGKEEEVAGGEGGGVGQAGDGQGRAGVAAAVGVVEERAGRGVVGKALRRGGEGAGRIGLEEARRRRRRAEAEARLAEPDLVDPVGKVGDRVLVRDRGRAGCQSARTGPGRHCRSAAHCARRSACRPRPRRAAPPGRPPRPRPRRACCRRCRRRP